MSYRSEKSKRETVPFRMSGVGKQIAKHLARLDIYSSQDLLFHFPYRYQDRTKIQNIAMLIPEQEAVIQGVIQSITKPFKGRTKLLIELSDETGTIQLRFFHVLTYQMNLLKMGTTLRCYSEVRMGLSGLEMFHPEIQVITPTKPLAIPPYLTPIYPATDGLSQYMLRKLTRNALTLLQQDKSADEFLPATLLYLQGLPTFKEALQFIHAPSRETSMEILMMKKTNAQQRLIFEELLAHRISLLHVKNSFQAEASVAFSEHGKLSDEFLKRLPFQLTNAQKRVVDEISNDLMKPHPMLRLVQGDVGSGKTVVAALAMLQVIQNGYQAAMMAPTELLAEQHYRVFERWLKPLHINVVFISGKVKASERKKILQEIKAGTAQIILGTHALFQNEIQFAHLALVIVDEQHRFGVHQRALFREKGKCDHYAPHQLIMTATPIPRTLAMSFYADLDCSTIDELPPNRTKVTTTVLTNARRDEVIVRIKAACEEGRQAYWVCPLIEESEILNCQAATETKEQLQNSLPHLKVGLIHGRMNAPDKEAMMRAFIQNEIHMLVATTVIEVGVDVSNASLMVIENAERLGLSQLHQLRGRVGRGDVQSHCVLLYQAPLSPLAKERLNVMRETTDGFKIAQRDLELRGPGEFFGTKQTGELSFRIADLIRDSELLPKVDQAAEMIMQHHHELIAPLMKRWLGDSEAYGKI